MIIASAFQEIAAQERLTSVPGFSSRPECRPAQIVGDGGNPLKITLPIAFLAIALAAWELAHLINRTINSAVSEGLLPTLPLVLCYGIAQTIAIVAALASLSCGFCLLWSATLIGECRRGVNLFHSGIGHLQGYIPSVGGTA